MAVGQIGTIVPPGVKPDAAEVLRLRAKLDQVHAQLMAGSRPSPQRMVDLLNDYLDSLRRLHGGATSVAFPKVARTTGSAVPNVCIIPAPPAPPVPIPFPNVPSSSATKTDPGKQQVQRSKLEATHHQIKSNTGIAAGSGNTPGLVSSYVKGVCEFVLYSFDVKTEGKNVTRLGDPLWHNKRNG